MGHTSQALLSSKIAAAKEIIKVGSHYYHYRNQDDDHKYRVEMLALDEESEKVVVVYKALYGDELLWVRSLENFSEEVEYAGQKTERFILAG
jgi:hypothetical protein